MSGPNFNQLIQQSVQLVEKTGMRDFKVPRNLRQLSEASKRQVENLGTTARVTPTATAQANALLAPHGYNVEKPIKTLNQLSKIQMRTKFEPREQLRPTDLKEYLEHQYHIIALNAIEEASRRTTENFDSSYRQAVFREWKEKKRQLIEDEIGHHSLNWKSNPVPFCDTTIPGTPYHSLQMAGGVMNTPSARRGSSPIIDEKMQTYFLVVQELNKSHTQSTGSLTLRLVGKFRAAANSIPFSALQQNRTSVTECWELIERYTETPTPVRERFYLQNNNRRDFIERARSFLESQMSAHILAMISRRADLVPPGGDPDPINNIKAYVNLKGLSSIWALIYYLVRCGELDTAIRECAQHRNETGNFHEYLQLFKDNRHKIPNQILSEIRHKYATLIQSKIDVHKVALYKIVGCCDVRKSLPEVFVNTPDFMWLKLTLIRDGGEYSLGDLKINLARFGPSHFNPKGTSPLLYFQVLLLSQQFEKAVHYLLVNEEFRIEGVHFAIALYHYGLLQQPDPNSKGYPFLFYDPSSSSDGPSTPQQPATPLSSGLFSISEPLGKTPARSSFGSASAVRSSAPEEQPTINMAKLLQKYSQSFESIDVGMALHYLYVLGENSASEAASKAKCIQELVLRTRSFLVFEPPLCQMLGDTERVREMQREAALYSYRNGSVEDAIHLCNLARDYDGALTILSSELSRTLTVRGEDRNNAFDRMQQYMEEYHQKVDTATKSYQTYNLLCQLFMFFEYYWAGSPESLTKIAETGLLPIGHFSEQELFQQITTKVALSRTLDPMILRNFADILVCTMELLHHEYQSLKLSALPDRAVSMGQYRFLAKGLLTFAGMLEYQLPATALTRLAQTEAAMI